MTKKEKLLIMIDFCIENELDLYIEISYLSGGMYAERMKHEHGTIEHLRDILLKDFDDRLINENLKSKIISFRWI